MRRSVDGCEREEFDKSAGDVGAVSAKVYAGPRLIVLCWVRNELSF